MLLIHNEEPEVFEADIPLDEPMRPNHDIDIAQSQLANDLALLFAAPEARDALNPEGVAGHPLAKRIEMLLNQDRGRCQQSHLLARHDRLESGPNRHLRFAKTDVAADQPVHWPPAFHLFFGLGNRLELVGGLFVFKGAFKNVLPLRVRRKGKTGLSLAHRLYPQEIAGHVFDRFLRLGACILPASAAQPAQRRPRPADTDIFIDQMRLGHRHVEPRRRFKRLIGGKLQNEALGRIGEA